MRRIQTLSVDFTKANMPRFNLMCKFIVYKHSFNSIIYNYYPKTTFELGRVPWSERTISRHIKDFIRLGWAKQEGNNIVFLSKQQLQKTANKKKRSFYYKLKCKLEYKEIRTHLYDAILKRKFKQMMFVRSLKLPLQDRKNFMQCPWANREGLRIGLRKISRLFWYKSISSAKLRVREIVEKRLLNNRRFRPTLIYCDKLGGFKYKNPCTIYYYPTPR